MRAIGSVACGDQLGCRNLETSSQREKRVLPSERAIFVVYQGILWRCRRVAEETTEGELAISKRLSKSRSRILVYEASCLGMNGGLGLNEGTCGRGPMESLADGEDVEDSSRRRRIGLAVMESDIPRVTLRNEG